MFVLGVLALASLAGCTTSRGARNVDRDFFMRAMPAIIVGMPPPDLTETSCGALWAPEEPFLSAKACALQVELFHVNAANPAYPGLTDTNRAQMGAAACFSGADVLTHNGCITWQRTGQAPGKVQP